MVRDSSLTLCALLESDLTYLAQDCANQARPGDCVLLSGEVGAGKTTFARAFIMQRGGKNPASPTYTLVHHHDTEQGPLWHIDLWRIKDPDEVLELGWEDIDKVISLIEWPEKLGPWYPAHDQVLHLSLEQSKTDENARTTHIRLGGDWRTRLWPSLISRPDALLSNTSSKG
ncbi:MAG: tRNA (adenosine(37)-N6)-threonylcarbamoyltransferase complex ATPase subunit type 1 TsaE [Pseudomonadota bacterium]